MTLLLAHLAFLAVVGPLLFLLARAIPTNKPRGTFAFLLALMAAGAFFFFTRAHEDVLTGVDSMAYRKMAETFLEGRELIQRDVVATLPPAEIATNFYYRPISRLRPTRDVIFQIDPVDSTTCPFFEPVLPLAAAGSHMPRTFISLLAVLWLGLLLCVCVRKSSGRGLIIALGFSLATAWPAWHLRGYHAEGAAAVLAAMVYLSSVAKPFEKPLSFAIAAFSLGLSICIHPTAILFSVPVALSLVPSAQKKAQRRALLTGAIVGFLPIIFITRYVCHPYGDWTRPDVILQIARNASEHGALLLGACALALAGVAALVLSSNKRARTICGEIDRKLGPVGWTVLAVFPLVLVTFVSLVAPSSLPFCQLIRNGFESTWSGIGLPCALLWAYGFLSVVIASRSDDAASRSATSGDRILLVLLCWTSLVFLLLKGVETHVGLWSHRRLLPTVLLLTSLFAVSAASWNPCARFPKAKWLLLVLFIACSLGNLVRGPGAYFLVNEEGTRAWREKLNAALQDGGLTFFDYHPHSVPFAADPGNTVLGLGRHATGRWPAIEQWLSSVAETGTVTIATSWTPSQILESDASLRPYRFPGSPTNLFEASYPVLATKAFFPMERRIKTVSVSLFSFVPNSKLDQLAQDKTLDGGPIGLRGPWGKTRNATTWTRQGSAIVGPVTNRGTIVVTLDAVWPEHPELPAQRMTLTPPWGESGAVSFQVPSPRNKGEFARIVLELPAPADATARTGLYTFTSLTPYDPAKDGLRGYDDDLGIVLHRIRIETRAD